MTFGSALAVQGAAIDVLLLITEKNHLAVLLKKHRSKQFDPLWLVVLNLINQNRVEFNLDFFSIKD